MASDPAHISAPKEDERAGAAPLVGTRGQSLHRLQVGLFGLAAVLLIVWLANVIMERAREAEEASVPDAVSAVAGQADGQGDGAVAAGAVPEIAADPVAEGAPATMKTESPAPADAQASN